jgi:hypothetical protein
LVYTNHYDVLKVFEYMGNGPHIWSAHDPSPAWAKTYSRGAAVWGQGPRFCSESEKACEAWSLGARDLLSHAAAERCLDGQTGIL